MANFYSAVDYVGDNASTDFNITFPYIAREDIYIFLQPTTPAEAPYAVLVRGVDWDFLTDTTITFLSAPLAGEKIVIRRFTERGSRLSQFYNGSTLTENDLNLVTLQLLYIVQEMLDFMVAGGDPDIVLPGGPTDPGDIDLDLDGIVQTVIDELLNSQLFLDLISLIDLVDINAESIIGNILNTHDSWGLGRVRDNEIADANALIDANFGTLQAQDARIVTIETSYVNADEALAARIDALQVSFDTYTTDTDASILTIQQVIADGDSALAQEIKDLEASVSSDISANSARLTTVESVNVTQESAIASLVTEVNARVEISGLEALLISSSHISGIKATADLNEASVQTIESSLATVITDVTNNTGNLAALQIESGATAAAESVNTSWRQSLAVAFGLDFDEGGSDTAAAIESRWEAYADVDSITAQAVTTLQASTTPILFRDTVPDQSEAPFGNPPQWSPGTTWMDTSNGMKPYIWDPSATAQIANGFPYYVGPVLTGGVGYWLAARDEDMNQVIGAAIQDSYDLIVDPLTGEVRASLTSTLEATLGGDITAVEESLQAYIDPTTGIMNSQWMVRLNQHISGTPVIAGVGLGLQSDPDNPEAGATSRFIVMADLFGIIAPPTGDELTGPLDIADIRVPFVVDANDGFIGIDGDLVVTGSLSSYIGAFDQVYLQKAVATALAVNGTTGRLEPVSANGNRLELASDAYWSGTDGTDFLMWAGAGSKNKANAVFWLDTAGNAFFGGEVGADNINGSLTDLSAIDVPGNVPVSTSYTTVATGSIGARVRRRNALASVSFNMFGSGADSFSARLQLREDLGGGAWGSWQTVSLGNYDTPSAVPATLTGAVNFNTAEQIQCQLQVKGNDGTNHTVNSIGGFLLGVS